MRRLKIIIAFIFSFLFFWIFYCLITLPSLTGLGNKTRAPSIIVFDRNNEIVGSIGDVYGGEILKIKEVPQHLIDSILILEDRRFYTHNGIDLKGLLRAISANLREMKYVQGASTITQQLSKLIFLDAEKNLSRKLRELIISFYLEFKYTKDEIFLMYINRVYLGAGMFGVKAASKRYFSKSFKELSIAESALIAGLLKAPSRLSPFSNISASTNRAKLVISLLNKEEKINMNQYNEALSELTNLKKKEYFQRVSPKYFIDWIYSTTPDGTLNNKKDLHIYSTLDFKLQEVLEKVVKKNTNNLDENIQTAVVVMDYEGEVKGIVGGRSWYKSKFNRATQSKRQIGSVFKTYVYLTALSVGYDINDFILDEPIVRNGWKPKNFANKYRGKITLKEAFASSSNVAAVRLSEEVGRLPIIKMTKKLGIISNIPDEPSMPLGVSSMSLLEVVGSFGAICGNGRPVIPYGIKEIRHRNNFKIWKRDKPSRKTVIEKRTLNKIKTLLKEVITNGTGRKLSNMSYKVIGKTGTSQKNRDAWFIGCSRNHVIGVWVGRDDDKSMENIFGSTLPLQIFKQILISFR